MGLHQSTSGIVLRNSLLSLLEISFIRVRGYEKSYMEEFSRKDTNEKPKTCNFIFCFY